MILDEEFISKATKLKTKLCLIMFLKQFNL